MEDQKKGGRTRVLRRRFSGLPPLAHHSIAMFDFTKEWTLTGVIESFDYTNPHTWIKLQVPGAEGKVEVWGLEGMSPNALTRAGWTKNTLTRRQGHRDDSSVA